MMDPRVLHNHRIDERLLKKDANLHDAKSTWPYKATSMSFHIYRLEVGHYLSSLSIVPVEDCCQAETLSGASVSSAELDRWHLRSPTTCKFQKIDGYKCRNAWLVVTGSRLDEIAQHTCLI